MNVFLPINGTAGPAVPRATAGEATPQAQEAREAAESFEALFLTQVLESMSAGLGGDSPFSGGPAEGAWRSMLNEQYAGAITAAGGVGIAEQVYQEILRQQEASAK